jgi:hypothetical protein
MAAMLVLAGLTAVAAPLGAVGLAAVLAATLGTCSAPATRRVMSELAAVPGELLGANAASASVDGVACLIGPAIAGILAAANLLPIAFALNGLSFGAVALAAALAGDVTPEASGSRSGAEPVGAPVAAEWGATTGQPRWVSTLLPALLLDAAISFASAALGVVTVLIAIELLRMDGAFAAVLGTAAGAGGIVGGLAAGACAAVAIERRIAGGLAAATGSVLVLALAGDPIVAAIAMAGSSGALVLLETLNVTRIQLETRDGGTGRAFGLLHTTAAAAMLAGAVIPAVAATFGGIHVALLLVAVVVATLGATSIAWSRGVAGRSPAVPTLLPRESRATA